MQCRPQGTRPPNRLTSTDVTEEEIRSLAIDINMSRQLQTVDKEQKVSEAERAMKTTDEVRARKTIESSHEVQKGSENEKVSPQHQQQANDAHNVTEAKKTEAYTAAGDETSKKSLATQSTGSGLRRPLNDGRGVGGDGHDKCQNHEKKSAFASQPPKVQPRCHVQDELRLPVNHSHLRSNPACPTLIQSPGCGSCAAV